MKNNTFIFETLPQSQVMGHLKGRRRHTAERTYLRLKKEETLMLQTINLSEVTDMFLMRAGIQAMQDMDTPSFMRKAYGIALVNRQPSRRQPQVVEPDEKIINFLSVIKRKDMTYLPHAG